MKKSQIFSEVPVDNPDSNYFDLSHEVKGSGKFGYVYPILCEEVLPGDNVNLQTTCFLRMAPTLAPIMHQVIVKTHKFYVPARILNVDFEDFITGGQDGTANPVLPYMTMEGIAAAQGNNDLFKPGTLWDFIGLPAFDSIVGALSQRRISILPILAYRKLFNDWYRDPNFDQEKDLLVDANGDQSAEIQANGLLTFYNVGWEKDYFTSCLPFAQRGPEVLMPLSGTGDVLWAEPATDSWVTYAGGLPAPGAPNINVNRVMTDSAGAGIHPADGVATVNLTSSGSSINDLRRSIAIQGWLEAAARGGGRYVENTLIQFRTRIPDYRLQRSEYLGGGREVVRIDSIVSTYQSDADAERPLGSLAGKGTSVGKTNRINYQCPEHGFVIEVMFITLRTAYQQGLRRMFTRATKFDYAWPRLAHIGEQEVRNEEVFYSPLVADDGDNIGTFGYNPRYSEYKYCQDRICGDFRTTLGFWHEARVFTSSPALDSAFTTLKEDGGTNEESFRRIFAVQDGTDYLWFQCFHKLGMSRKLPYFGVPKIQ